MSQRYYCVLSTQSNHCVAHPSVEHTEEPVNTACVCVCCCLAIRDEIGGSPVYDSEPFSLEWSVSKAGWEK